MTEPQEVQAALELMRRGRVDDDVFAREHSFRGRGDSMSTSDPAPEVVELAALLTPFLPPGRPTTESVAVAAEAMLASSLDFCERMLRPGTDFRASVVSMLAERAWSEFNAERLVERWQR